MDTITDNTSGMAPEQVDKLAEKITADPGLTCPKCGEQMTIELVSKALDTSRVSFSMQPHPGEFLSASNVGKALTAMEGVFIAVGKELGVRTTVTVESIDCTDGGVKFNLLLARHEGKVGKRSKAA